MPGSRSGEAMENRLAGLPRRQVGLHVMCRRAIRGPDIDDARAEQRAELLDQGDDVAVVRNVGPALNAGRPMSLAFRGLRPQCIEYEIGDTERRAQGDEGLDVRPTGSPRVSMQGLVGDDRSERVGDENARLLGHSLVNALLSQI